MILQNFSFLRRGKSKCGHKRKKKYKGEKESVCVPLPLSLHMSFSTRQIIPFILKMNYVVFGEEFHTQSLYIN